MGKEENSEEKSKGITFEGGPGDKVECAVVIRGAANHSAGVLAEYQYLEEKFGEPEVDWKMAGQTLLTHEDRMYDRMEIKLSEGSLIAIIFDITDFFGKF